MAYGTVKAKSLIYESGGSDVVFNTNSLIQNGANFSGGIIQGQTISGATGVFTTLLSGSLIQATTFNTPVLSSVSGIFTTLLSGSTITGSNLDATTITGNGISGATLNVTTGVIGNTVITGTISGNTLTGSTVVASTIQAITGIFTSQISGNLLKANNNTTVVSGSGDVRPYGLFSFPALAGVSGQILTSNGDGNTNWEADIYAVEVVTGPVTGEAGKTYVLTTGTTITLPDAPATGAFLTVVNRSNTVTGTVARNGNSIMGEASDLTIDDVSFSVDFIYFGDTQGWVFI